MSRAKPEVFQGEDGKWGFRYWHPKDQDWTEDYGFATANEAELALGAELEDLFIECEGEVDA